MLNIQLQQLPTIETKRLILRQQQVSDAPALYELRTDENVMRYIDRQSPKNLQESEAVIEDINRNVDKGLSMIWAITQKNDTSRMIGNLGYWRTDLMNHRAEIGYMLHPDYWRQGILSEALDPILKYGFQLGFHSICANINPGNDASRQLLLKHGFIKEAYFKGDYYFNGKFLDSEIYGLLTDQP